MSCYSIYQHCLAPARQLASPNCDLRPLDSDISLLVIHNISLPAGQFGTGCVEQLFTNCLDYQAHPDFDDLAGLTVSSHLLIDRDGQLTQFVPFDKRAWHAGQSSFQGRSRCNDFSIGIELEGADDIPYTDQQYRALAACTAVLLASYPQLNQHRIVGHSDIAPGRKTDPGDAFRWDYFHQLLASQVG